MDTLKSAAAVSIVDLSTFTTNSSSNSLKRAAATELAEKGKINGCIGISGHGVSPELLTEAFKVTQALFDLPYSEKMKAPHPDGPTPHRGYSGTGRERPAAKTESESWEEVRIDEGEKMTDCKVCMIKATHTRSTC
jgi:isopenicillin N synthase-like dioxygenase